MASDYLFGIFEPFLQSIIFQINEKQKTPKFKQTFYDDTNLRGHLSYQITISMS
jgi:hypothetical protein